MSNPLISLCIPTNGVIEWVFPVLDSIYTQGVLEDVFEVVVTDNGCNEEFQDKMIAYSVNHSNLIYEKTTAPLFLNEIEAYKRAKGEFIKFVNHRTILLPGTLQIFIEFVKENRQMKPIVYFANGVLEKNREVFCYDSFATYVEALSYWSSWSTGMGFWKEDFEKLPSDIEYNELFPHVTILFSERKRDKYIVDNRNLLSEMRVNSKSKGKYDLFYAFAIEYPGILCDLLRDGSISIDVFLRLKKECLKCITSLYISFVLQKNPCAYDLTSFDTSIRVYFSKRQVWGMVINKGIRKIMRPLLRKK